jgi:hypothetical protein
VHGYSIEAADYIVEEPDDDNVEEPAADTANTEFDPEKPMISLAAIAGVRTKDTM